MKAKNTYRSRYAILFHDTILNYLTHLDTIISHPSQLIPLSESNPLDIHIAKTSISNPISNRKTHIQSEQVDRKKPSFYDWSIFDLPIIFERFGSQKMIG